MPTTKITNIILNLQLDISLVQSQRPVDHSPGVVMWWAGNPLAYCGGGTVEECMIENYLNYWFEVWDGCECCDILKCCAIHIYIHKVGNVLLIEHSNIVNCFATSLDFFSILTQVGMSQIYNIIFDVSRFRMTKV